MKAGIWGISTALEYPSCSYYDVEEIAKACKMVKRFNGIYSTHMRNENGKEDLLQQIELQKNNYIKNNDSE